MLTCRFSQLADSIAESAVPKWLSDYVRDNRKAIIETLNSSGVYKIPMPDGGNIIIRADNK